MMGWRTHGQLSGRWYVRMTDVALAVVARLAPIGRAPPPPWRSRFPHDPRVRGPPAPLTSSPRGPILGGHDSPSALEQTGCTPWLLPTGVVTTRRASSDGQTAASSTVDLAHLAARYQLEGAERWDDAIVVARRGRTGVVLLDRPHAGNSHNRAMIHALGRAWLHFGDLRDIRVIVIGATTDRNFCTGIDLKEVAAAGGFAGLAEHAGFEPVRGSGQTHRDAGVRKPVITAVEGRTIGGGLHWVAEADIVIVGENATFRDTHVERGFVGNRENLDLALKAGLGAALYLSLVGGQVELDAQRALTLGLVQEVVPRGRH